ncbi:acyl CoA:acetate/3-ketoacid CoA transferase [Ammonicoccus fulvus]|uniref:Acyl CoA:acetate/3-ketoacid CoA transferase n=1 Tax=Ammonicoccus fulvus TaxID=3138240 RepID=A0ABZ3FIK9_9ACTN
MRHNHPLKNPGSSGKIVTSDEAVRLIRDGDTVATAGFVGIGFAENIAVALERRFLGETGDEGESTPGGHPRNLTLVYAAGQGDGKEKGLNHFGHAGLIARVIGGHWGLVPAISELAMKNQIEAWNLPQGVICHLYRDIAAGKAGTLTRVGLDTFVDPRHGGGRLNEVTTTDLVRVMEIDGEEHLFYKAFPINVGIIRATTADPDGNLTMEREALTLEAQAIAMAARNSGGIVIAQVERIADRGSLNARQVKIPGVMVDCVVVAERPEYHQQTFAAAYNPAYASEIRVPASSIPPMPLGVRKVAARRAAQELRANDVVNLGIGMPEAVASVAAEERIIDLLTLTAEPGVIGGVPAGGLDFGAATNAQAIIDQPAQFDFYDGGGLDIAVLGLAQVDREGNVNVSKFGSRVAGAGGFINISQNTGTVVFLGSFLAGRTAAEIRDGELHLADEGGAAKFVDAVEHRTFSGRQALANGQQVLYVTERCVFRLVAEGLELIEIAPGVDLERDILARMAFRPIIKGEPTPMDSRIFRDAPMDLRTDLLAIPLSDRLLLDADQKTFFVDFEGLQVRTEQDIEEIHRAVVDKLAPLGERVPAIVNYDQFSILPELVDPYVAMVQDLMDTHYTNVTRYTSNAFLRAQLGSAMRRGEVLPNLFESRQQAEAELTTTLTGPVRRIRG